MDSTGRSTSRHAASDGLARSVLDGAGEDGAAAGQDILGEKMSQMMKMHAAVEP